MKTIERAYLPLLILSLALNAFMLDLWRTTKYEFEKADKAVKTCNQSVVDLKKAGDKQAEDNARELDAAKARADSAYERAMRELKRPPAVPGNACASAQVENREWLENRRPK